MRWTKARRIVETKLKSGKIKFQVVEHLADGRQAGGGLVVGVFD